MTNDDSTTAQAKLPLRYADASMYAAAPMTTNKPTVYLVSMTPDPLGSIAAACQMYEGKVVVDKSTLTNEERLHYWRQVQATHLKAPLEFVDLHFMIEGVTRSFTHQLVRQRTAVYAQESLRFAVKEDLKNGCATPPSIEGGSEDVQRRWQHALDTIEEAYAFFIANGIPAEDAREILPHATLTRLHYKTNLRNLADHAGNRLCTQAQFHWRWVFAGISLAIINYLGERGLGWQAEEIVGHPIFRPACYQMGHCPFKADFDRGCTIRGRVDTHAAAGNPSTEWHDIKTEEWLLNPRAAWQ